MKNFGFKKVVASLAALSLAAVGMSAVTASASTYVDEFDLDINTAVYIDQVVIPAEDAGKQIPVYVRLNSAEFPQGLSSIEFGIEVDSRCTYEFSTANRAVKNGGEALALDPTYETADEPNQQKTWFAGAKKTDFFDEADYDPEIDGPFNLVLVMVTLPSDAQPGVKYDIKYMKEGVADPGQPARQQLYKNGSIVYAAQGAGTVSVTDGWIMIEGDVQTEPPATEPPATEPPATEPPATEPPATEPPATDTEAPATETEAPATETGTETNAPTTTAATTAAGGTTSSSGSPQTGASDVLPIAGAAAAVAVLGGVALVAKKKND